MIRESATGADYHDVDLSLCCSVALAEVIAERFFDPFLYNHMLKKRAGRESQSAIPVFFLLTDYFIALIFNFHLNFVHRCR
ncbi:hypothetical protein SDC9_152242 [bioreactor metagenome]|uniref:Uncharacterized protein n=1 Tax=bioreactor metagenome TaxID=1076179 RepID=A0A645EWW5_9ZZZZ